jgi:hypothetical protein
MLWHMAPQVATLSDPVHVGGMGQEEEMATQNVLQGH